jgi:hypothetical protein
MKPAVFRLVLCASLFALWIGYLGYLVLTRPRTPQGAPLVLSRPQIQSSDVDVIAEIKEEPKAETAVTVAEVLSPKDAALKEGDSITVLKLDECRAAQRPGGPVSALDWAGPGKYLLPLRRLPGEAKHFEVANVPASPGFTDRNLVRIYPATSEALEQYRRIAKAPRQ